MNVTAILNRFVVSVTPSMHKVRRACLQAAVESALSGAAVSVTGLGRYLQSKAREKHRIKRIDRLCSNVHLHREIVSVYGRLTASLIDELHQPVIHIDWSDMDERQEHFLLRASLAAEGRSLTLYEELHPLKAKDKPHIHRAFLTTLKQLLPAKSAPIVVTDAGFRIPWFCLVQSLGWDYVGRVRNRTLCMKTADTKNEQWCPIKNLYQQATRQAKELGVDSLGESVRFHTRLVVLRRHHKGRRDKTASGQRARRSKRSLGHALREREPWLLATSLPKHAFCARRIAQIYATRMQIEESFRDLKTGLQMNKCGTRHKDRLEVLLLIAALAHTLLYWLGLAAKQAGAHWSYQSTSTRSRNILSNPTIGLCAYRDRRLKITAQHWYAARKKLQQTMLIPNAVY